MTSDLGLPATLRTRLAALARRIRLLRAARGLCLLLLTAAVSFGGLFLADILSPMSPETLRLALLGAATLGLLVLTFGLVVPVCRRIDADALAALIERRHPELAERLTSAVELAGTTDAYHGSRDLIALLLRETDDRVRSLNVAAAMPARRAAWLALAAVGAVGAAAAPALFRGDAYADFARRVRLALAGPEPAEATLAVRPTPAGGVAARGRPYTVLALVHARTGAALPDSATLVATDPEGKVSRHAMTPDGATLPALAAATCAFAGSPLSGLPLSGSATMLGGVGPRTRAFSHPTDRLAGDFTYHVEAGDARSDTCRVTAVRPVELSPDSPTVMVSAPPYANPLAHPEQKIPGLTELSMIEFGRTGFEFRFTRPAVVAMVEVTSDQQWPRRWLLPVTLAPDRQQGRFDVPALPAGVYGLRLHLEAEHRIDTVYELRPLTVTRDGPPTFAEKPDLKGVSIGDGRPEWIVGSDALGGDFKPARGGVNTSGTRAVAPGDTLRLKVAVEDRVGVGRVELEYRVNGGSSRFETVAEGGGLLRAQPAKGVYNFGLAGKAKDGDVVLFRLKAADNRSVARHSGRDADGAAVPAVELAPQVIYYPERQGATDRWHVLRVSRLAEPVARQEIQEQRDAIRERLDVILKKLTAERATLARLRRETEDWPKLSAAEAADVSKLRRDHREITADLRDLAERAADGPALRHVAATAAEVADREMHRADDSMKQALQKTMDAAQRDQRLDWALGELGSAQRKLERLREGNEKLAQERLDRMKLEELAARQQELAREAEALAAKDPQAKTDLNALRAEQDRVAEELKRLARESELFRGALDATRAEQAKRLADEAAELARQQRELNQAASATAKKEMEDRFGELARRQQKLAWKTADFAKESKAATQAAGKQPLRPEDAERAADALREGDAPDALIKQERQLKELERLAQDLDGPREVSRDPRDAARQLAKLQEALKQRVLDESKKKGERAPQAERLKAIEPDQEALRLAAKALDVPVGQHAARDAQRQALDHMTQAREALRANNADGARNRMEQARQALERLAGSLPSADQRRQQALNEVAQIRREQEDVARQAEQALRQSPKLDPSDPKARGELGKRLADAARRQAHLAERLGKLDAAGQPARQQDAEQAMNRALDDLIEGRGADVSASQKAARQSLERLEQALRGKQPGEPAAPPVAQGVQQPPRQAAQQLAGQQKDLAEATKKVRDALPKAATQGKPALEQALQKLAREQAKLNERAARIPADKVQTAAQQARHLMQQAQHALQRNDGAEARRQQLEAVAALDRLARALPDKHPEPAAPPLAQPALPLNQQAEQARALAKEQQELRDAVQKMAALRRPEQKVSPLAELSRLQRDLARAVADLAAQVAKAQGQLAPASKQAQQAAQAARQTAEKAEAGSPQAPKAGEQAAQDLRDLAKALSGDAKAAGLAQQAADLAKQQERLSGQMGPLAKDAAAQQAQQNVRQAELSKQAAGLTKDLGKLAQDTATPQAKQAAGEAQSAAQQARAAMQQARAQAKQGNPGKAGDAGQQAAEMLDKAARQASQAAQQMAGGQQPGAEAGKTADALRQGQQQIGEAQGKLAQGQPGEATGAMDKAAQSLQQAAASAAKQAEQAAPPGEFAKEPGQKGAAPTGLPDLGPLGKELQKYAGRPWGEVPGELRTRLLQEMRGRYGDDYGDVIQRYFEQIADTNRPRR